MSVYAAAFRHLQFRTSSSSFHRAQPLLLFALIFAALLLLHAPLLRLPYFWDEAGYYIPAAYDLYRDGALIPHSTISNAHPPLVMALLALAWRVAGFSPLVARSAMLAIAAFSLLGLFRLARRVANLPVAVATVTMVALYPVFFSQSSLAQLDVAAAGFTFWGLLAYVEDRSVGLLVWFSLASLTKETAILAPVALFAWEIASRQTRQAASLQRWAELFPPTNRRTRAAILLLPLVPLACWYGFHYAQTGYVLGNPEFFRYNVGATVDAERVPFALGVRLWQLFGYFGLYLLTLAGLLALIRDPQSANQPNAKELIRRRIPVWIQGAFLSVAAGYLLFMAVIGGAALARYMLPVVPLIMMVLISTLWRRVRYWTLIVTAIALVFVTGLFHNPPYTFSLEDNLAYRDFIALHVEAIRFLEMRFPHARVLTAWPASDELNRPWLGYVSQPFPIVRIEDFTPAQIAQATGAHHEFDVALVFSTKYEPPHPMFENWVWWRQVKERFFGYHRDLRPQEIASRLGGTVLFHKETKGLWIAVIHVERDPSARLHMAW